jgi:hypothetical protein
MTIKPTIFTVFDIETTLKKRIAFDIAWKSIDRAGRVYGQGSYIVREAFQHDVPFFAEKLGLYFDDAYLHRIKPASILDIRAAFSNQVRDLQNLGHRVILAAYNSAFDAKYLPETLKMLTGNPDARWCDTKVELMDIWDYWGESVPRHYAKSAAASNSGRFVSTSAESAYRYEFVKPDFEEYHRAWHDVEIESEILLRALSRKKRMHIVKSPAALVGAVWKKINTRIGIDGKAVLPQAVNKEMVAA